MPEAVQPVVLYNFNIQADSRTAQPSAAVMPLPLQLLMADECEVQTPSSCKLNLIMCYGRRQSSSSVM
jgi:hypothetical protein